MNAEESVFERSYLEIPVQLKNGKVKTWTPNRTSLKALSKVYGDDVDLWVGKHVKIQLAKQNVRGEMKQVIYAEPAEALKEPQQSPLKVEQ